MTTVYTSPLATSDPKAVGTNVFIIGVGEYPCLIGGKGKVLEKTMGLKQLSSPPVSAAGLASWFLGRQGLSHAKVGFHNPNVPLATVEMLLSPSQSYTRPGGGDVLVETATNSNIVSAFDRWAERAAANDDNIAVFYFCGHGVMGNDAYLLPSDFGAVHPSNPWADAIDIDHTAKAMRREVGCPLYFFIDACRQAARDPLSPGATPPALKYIDFSKPVRGFSRLILWANGEGEAAFGPATKVSRFTQALIEALSGYEAEPARDGKGWIVTGSLLAGSVSKILETGNASLEPDKYQHSEQQLISSLPFHVETAPPHQIVMGMPT
jgi:caspase domain-containing protein